MIQKPWVHPSSLHNHVMGNHLVDWLELYGIPKELEDRCALVPREDSFQQQLAKMGMVYEERVVQLLQKHFEVECVRRYDDFEEGVRETKCLLDRKVQVISGGYLVGRRHRIRGRPDLLVRSDLVSLIGDVKWDWTGKGRCNIDLEWNTPYVVLEVKFHSLQKSSTGSHLLLNNSLQRYFKLQIHMYNLMLTETLGTNDGSSSSSPICAVIGKPDIVVLPVETGSLTALVETPKSLSVGLYLPEERSNTDVSKLVREGIRWRRKLVQEGMKWKCWPEASVPELLPNLCAQPTSNRWSNFKLWLANERNDVTMLWKCGPTHRHNLGKELGMISSTTSPPGWKHEQCTSKRLGLSGNSALALDLILEVNRDNPSACFSPLPLSPLSGRKKRRRQRQQQPPLHSPPPPSFLPSRIRQTTGNWRESKDKKSQKNKAYVDLFVDFETVQRSLFDGSSRPTVADDQDMVLFMIGVGREQEQEQAGGNKNSSNSSSRWAYRNFVAAQLTTGVAGAERSLVKEYVEHLQSFVSDGRHLLRLFHWSSAEPSIWRRVSNRYPDLEVPEVLWVDLCSLFRKEPVAVRGALNYGLKSVCNAMQEQGFIVTKWKSDCQDGTQAMLHSWQMYHNQSEEERKRVRFDLVDYNETDCKVLHEILLYLRKYR